jgi:outer membrane receptor protein involved in Fe transport
MSKRVAVFGSLLLLLFGTLPLLAQATTGSLSGTVVDATGGTLPGVTVELTGPSMQGAHTQVTDSKGNFRFLNVPPGENYRITASLSGFASQTKTVARVYLGHEGTVNFTLQAAAEAKITVTAEAPLVDVTKTTTGVNVTASQFESLPTARSFQQLTAIAPGVTMEMGEHDRRFNQSPNVGASSAPENNYIIDGLSTTDPRYGTSGTNLTMNFVEEVQVMTGGYSAEYGRSTGGVFNVVTKSGGNDVHGDVFGYYRNHSWTPEELRAVSKQLQTESSALTNKDIGASIGGPIAKDRVWFFAAIDPTRRTTFIGNQTDTSDNSTIQSGNTLKSSSNIYAGKLTFAINPNHQLVGTIFGDPTHDNGWLLAQNEFGDPSTAIRDQKTGGNNINVKYTGTLSSRWLIEAAAGQHNQKTQLGPGSTAGEAAPRQIDETIGGFQHGGFLRFQDDKAKRNSYQLKSSNFLGAHDLRYGIDLEQNKYDGDLHEEWYRYFGYASRTPSAGSGKPAGNYTYIQDRSYFVQGSGPTDNNALFFQDEWKVRPNLQFNLGIRYEEQKLGSAQGVAVAFNKDQADDPTIAPVFSSVKLKNNWAPRLGVIWDPMNNGRSKLFGFVGRFFEAIPLDLNIRAINGERYIIKQYYSPKNYTSDNFVNPSGSPISSDYFLNSTSNLTLVTPLADGLKAQYQDEISFGYDYQFGPTWKAGINLTDRELKRVIEDFGVFNDPSDPTALTSYVIGNPGEGSFGAPFEKPKRYYRAAEITLQRAKANNWQLYSSFVYAKARGNYEGLYISGYDQLDPNITALYDIPSFLNNAMGKLRADKPYQLKVHSAYTFPFGLTVGEAFMYSAGIPISAQGPEIVNGYGDGTIFLLPRGSEGRTPNYWNLDLHFDYALPMFAGGGRGLSLIVDAFNVFNQHKPLEVDQDYIYEGMDPALIAQWEAPNNLDEFGNPKYNASLGHSPFFKTPTLYQAPRAVQLGVKFTY